MGKKKKKRVTFGSLKSGAKFKFGGHLYLKDASSCPVTIIKGAIAQYGYIADETLVIPVKVSIKIVEEK